ncbi:DUF7527 domain-containing protein [Haloarcula argentinensis]|uniref:DUF7527 domain-containing protein n=1 Tax=Haloarcula argentinensis TaxID=43776 RepID=A0A830FWX7_HALAR|nr:hypothetical protein [Haloarcula argentinensis]EMA18732.1 hypothetical protein C443_19589 [Haloarcula argentinensis DSM 12282]MDS0253706.1 hypothetical protein [Haloarcula argentinensis]GGM47403.1 hypothetical protein GCM10009006_30750 [Haloarcula argentinensis]
MSSRTVERVDGWESVPFDGGFAGLQDLAGQEFSGAVITGPTRLFMLNGTVVGVLDGTIEDFEDASGTAKRSPHEALPLLAVMQERADEVKAQYYTEDTALAEVDQTLSSGNFTGFIELSENVLSGDYYTVYHQGRSMSVAWVGNSDNLITDDEAFDTANDEVGIYEVMPVDIEPTEIPEPPEDDTDEQSADPAAAGVDPLEAGDETAVTDEGAIDSTPTDTAVPDEPTPQDDDSDEPVDPSPDPVGDTEADGTDDAGQAQTAAEPTRDRGPASSGPPGSKAAGATPGRSRRSSESDEQSSVDEKPNSDSRPDSKATDRATTDTDTATQTEPDYESTEQEAGVRETAGETEPKPSATEPSRTQESQHASARSTPAQSDQAASADRRAEPEDPKPTQSPEPQTSQTQSGTGATTPTPEASSGGSSTDLETRSVPSLDPNKSGGAQESTATSVSPTQTPPTGGQQASTPRRDQPAQNDPTPSNESSVQGPAPAQESRGTTAKDPEPAQPADTPQSQPSTGDQRQSPADEEPTPRDPERVAELESELEQRAETVSDLESELTDLEATNQELRDERDRLESELADARAEIDRLEEQLDEQNDAAAGSTRLSASEAINGTNLFVRYDSKGKATLEEAKDGEASREEVEANLRLEYHTQFEAEGATVNGTPFEEYLEDSIQYRFVNWLIRNLLYEIRDTGHAGAMKDLYEGLPAIDRAELNGNVTVTYTEDGQETRSQERFDVVVRDRMGNPLVVANINDSREPASEGQMSDLIRNAERVGNASGSLASAFLVTSSFFEPGALETAEEATSSGLFNRDKRKSFVNISRKKGFHLCLLEARNQEFHLAVPEL